MTKFFLSADFSSARVVQGLQIEDFFNPKSEIRNPKSAIRNG